LGEKFRGKTGRHQSDNELDEKKIIESHATSEMRFKQLLEGCRRGTEFGHA